MSAKATDVIYFPIFAPGSGHCPADRRQVQNGLANCGCRCGITLARPKTCPKLPIKAILNASLVQRQTLEMSAVEPAAKPQLGPQAALKRSRRSLLPTPNVRQLVRHFQPLKMPGTMRGGWPAREAQLRPYVRRSEMSDISPNQSTQEFALSTLSDISPGAAQMSDKQQLKFSTAVPPLMSESLGFSPA